MLCKPNDNPNPEVSEILDQSGQIKEKHILQGGKKNGISIYYSDGQIVQRVSYVDGIVEGPVEIYDNGFLQLIMNYHNEQLDGPMYQFEKNMLKQFGNYKNGKKSGVFYIFADQYLIKEETYKNDVLDGKSITYYPKSNQIFEIGTYTDGYKTGIWNQLDQTGNVIQEEEF